MKMQLSTLQYIEFILLVSVSACFSSFAYFVTHTSAVHLRAGENAWNRGRSNEALEEFRRAAQAGDLRPRLALKLARAAFAAGDQATGQAVLARLTGSRSRLQPDTLNTVAGIYDQYGMPQLALDALNKAGNTVLRSEPAAIHFAGLKARLGDQTGAEGLYRDILVKYPGNAAATLGLAQLLASNGNTKEAEALCRSLLVGNPGDRQARIVLGRVLTAAGRFEDAIVEYRKALEKPS